MTQQGPALLPDHRHQQILGATLQPAQARPDQAIDEILRHRMAQARLPHDHLADLARLDMRGNASTCGFDLGKLGHDGSSGIGMTYARTRPSGRVQADRL